jgi:D-serine deaminase-like pyridoxal phosphate-dependent protein
MTPPDKPTFMTTTLPAHLAELMGKPVSDIDTPALVIDIDAMKRNIGRLAEFAKKHSIRWRPHAKMHKSAALARMQMKAGAVGVCVQKTAEAEAMVAGGVYNVYISNQVIAPAKLARVAALTQRVAAHGGQIAIAVDSLEGVNRLAHAMTEARTRANSNPRDDGGAANTTNAATVIDVFVEIDVGQGRCGVAPGPAAVTLALEIRKHPALRFAGLQAYHGGAQHVRSALDRQAAIAQVVAAVLQTRQLIAEQGMTVGLVTGAGTGTFALETASGVYGELQAGSFLFMDRDYAANERDPAQPVFEHALFVKSQVVSVCTSHAVVDAGHKSHAIDSGLPAVHGLALDYANGGDEHGILRGAQLPALGDTVWLIPGHCDPTVNLHDFMVGVRGGLQHGTVEQIIRVDARGALT